MVWLYARAIFSTLAFSAFAIPPPGPGTAARASGALTWTTIPLVLGCVLTHGVPARPAGAGTGGLVSFHQAVKGRGAVRGSGRASAVTRAHRVSPPTKCRHRAPEWNRARSHAAERARGGRVGPGRGADPAWWRSRGWRGYAVAGVCHGGEQFGPCVDHRTQATAVYRGAVKRGALRKETSCRRGGLAGEVKRSSARGSCRGGGGTAAVDGLSTDPVGASSWPWPRLITEVRSGGGREGSPPPGGPGGWESRAAGRQ